MGTVITQRGYAERPYAIDPYAAPMWEGAVGWQGRFLAARAVGWQGLFSVYNVTNLRVLSRFPSRGTSAGNWTANSTAAGDFGAANLNTDIVEQVWRSATGVKTGIRLICDTQVTAVYPDTLGILGHNLTTSATIVWKWSNDPTFASFALSYSITPTANNIIWLASALPTAGYRYFAFDIDDNTNANPYLQIGTVVFGPGDIMNEDRPTDEILWKPKHYKDTIQTEGMTSVANDRGVKNAVTLNFKSLNYDKADFALLDGVFTRARTSLKCLWIPRPQTPTRFGLFGKIRDLPQQRDVWRAKDFIDLSIDIDEAL